MDPSQLPSRSDTPSVEEIHRLLEEYEEIVASGHSISISEFAERYPAAKAELMRLLPVAEFLGGIRVGESLPTSGKPVDVLPWKTLGDFQIVREIGRGGMGIVYEARQVSLDRRVALKLLPFAGLLSERQLQRFKNEARAAASLRHSHIVNVLGVGVDRSIHYYAMDFIDGADVSVVIRELHGNPLHPNSRIASSHLETVPVGALSTQRDENKADFFRTIAKLGIQAAEALQFAHEEGVIHRDVKPANLLLDKQGDVHIADFGLARVVAQDDLTMTGDVVGTVRYMSPEQLNGEDVVDQRTDVYSLGLTLYELLTGRPAFDQVNRAKLTKAIAERNPTSLRQLAPDVPRDLEKVIFRAIEKSPNDRYRSAAEFAADLRRFVECRPVVAQRPSRWKSAWKWCQRNPLLATATSLIVLATVAGLITTSWQLNRARAAEADARDAEAAARRTLCR